MTNRHCIEKTGRARTKEVRGPAVSRCYIFVVSYLAQDDVLTRQLTAIDWTHTPTRRTTLDVGVAYDTDLDYAQEVLTDAVRAVEGTHPGFGPGNTSLTVQGDRGQNATDTHTPGG